MNVYRDHYLTFDVPFLYEHEPDALRPDILDNYERMLEALAENAREWPETYDEDPDPVALGEPDAFDLMCRADALAALNDEKPWDLDSKTYYLDHKQELDALAA